MSSLKSNFLWNSSFQLVRILTPLITTPYLTRVLGSEGLGAYSYTYTVANYACLFILLGLEQYGNREIAKVRNDASSTAAVFSSILCLQVFWGAAVVIFYLAYTVHLFGQVRLYSLIWVLWVAAECIDFNWLFYGLEEFRLITIRNVIVRLLVVISIFLCVRDGSDVWAYCLLQALSFLFSNIALFPAMRRRVRWVTPKVGDVLRHVIPNLVLFAPIAAITLYVQANKLLLGWMSNMSEVAFYDSADKISVIPLSVIQSLGVVMLPRMSRINSTGNDELARNYFDLSIWFGSIMAFGFMFGIIAISPEFVPVFFGHGFEKCATLMPILALIIPSVAYSNAFGVQWLLPSERDGKYLLSVIFGAVTNLLLCALLIPSMASVGAACATVVAEFAVMCVQAVMLRKELPLFRYICEAAPYAVFGFVMFLVVRIVAELLEPGAWALPIEIAVGVFAYCAFCVAWLVVRRDERAWLVVPRLKGKR